MYLVQIREVTILGHHHQHQDSIQKGHIYERVDRLIWACTLPYHKYSLTNSGAAPGECHNPTDTPDRHNTGLYERTEMLPSRIQVHTQKKKI